MRKLRQPVISKSFFKCILALLNLLHDTAGMSPSGRHSSHTRKGGHTPRTVQHVAFRDTPRRRNGPRPRCRPVRCRNSEGGQATSPRITEDIRVVLRPRIIDKYAFVRARFFFYNMGHWSNSLTRSTQIPHAWACDMVRVCLTLTLLRTIDHESRSTQ